MSRWYYFVRSGNRFLPLKNRSVFPPRPDDAHPANGDPLTPWYEQQDHYDAHHIHVWASSKEDATGKAVSLLREGEKKEPHLHSLLFDQNP